MKDLKIVTVFQGDASAGYRGPVGVLCDIYFGVDVRVLFPACVSSVISVSRGAALFPSVNSRGVALRQRVLCSFTNKRLRLIRPPDY